MPITPNMNLSLPEPGETRGPEWAEKVNAALEDGVDAHDHSSGRGVKVPVSGLDVSSDFPFNGNNADSLRMARFDDQTSTLAGANDKRGLAVVLGDLYYNNGAGTPVRITEGATLSAAAFGAITNLPSVAFPNASAAWLDAYPGFAFYQASNVYARVKVGSVAIHEAGVESPNAITVKSPTALAAAYDLTLPPATPAADAFLTMNTSGVMAAQVRAGAIGTTDLAALAVTEAKLDTGAVTEAKIGALAVTDAKVATGISQGKIARTVLTESATCTLFTTSSTGWVDVTNLSATVDNMAGGVARAISAQLIAVTEVGSVNAAASGSLGVAYFRLAVDGLLFYLGSLTSFGDNVKAMPGALSRVIEPGPVVGPINLQVRIDGGTVSFNQVRLALQVLI